MSQARQNHPGRSHAGKTSQRRQVKKQFFRIRGEHEVLWIYNDHDWARAHLTKQILVCPDSYCSQRLIAKKLDATRYLSDMEKGGCGHFIPQGGGGLMTDEHLWLQGQLREMCRRLGYISELEVGYDGARVDLRVDSTPPYAFEVQRVSTSFADRRAARAKNGMRTLWVLPESDRLKDTGKGKGKTHSDPLFSEPCVRLSYRDGSGSNARVMTVDRLRSRVWQGDNRTEVHLRAGVTIGRLSADRLSFTSTWVPLEEFIRQVLSGDRQWYERRVIQGKNGGAWAGWLLTADVAKYKAAVAADQAERRQRREAEIAAAEAAAGSRREAEAAAARREQITNAEERQAAASVQGVVESAERVEPVRDEPTSPTPDPVVEENATKSDAPRSGEPDQAPDPWWRRLLRSMFG